MGSIMKLLQQVLYRHLHIHPKFVNKFTLVTCLFVIWVGLFDTHSFWDSFQLSRTISRLENEKVELRKNIEIAKADKLDLEGNKEKYAREKYFMHKDNEEVFIIERSK
ncbi:MAG: septum formation initiator family protein [Saprospiraceae bacterium]|jgi:cell division protein DivIC|nr:septum formation initiator family protein [Saprospiraceae bacterium]MBP9193768.1 septum formation initiator family protein [Saprospiraceae bacterium]